MQAHLLWNQRLLLMCRPLVLCVTLPWVRGRPKGASPSSLLQTTCGSGWPWTWHARVTLEPMSIATSDGSRVNLGAAVGFKVRDGKGSRYGTNPFSWFGFHRQLSCPLCELEQFYERTRSHRQFGICCIWMWFSVSLGLVKRLWDSYLQHPERFSQRQCRQRWRLRRCKLQYRRPGSRWLSACPLGDPHVRGTMNEAGRHLMVGGKSAEKNSNVNKSSKKIHLRCLAWYWRNCVFTAPSHWCFQLISISGEECYLCTTRSLAEVFQTQSRPTQQSPQCQWESRSKPQSPPEILGEKKNEELDIWKYMS